VPLRAIADPRLSPDGTRVAFVVRDDDGAHLCVDGGDLGVDPPPSVPHPTGGGALAWVGNGDRDLVYAAADGTIRRASDPAARPIVPWGGCGNLAVSPDGARVAFVFDERDVAVAPTDGSTWPVRVSSGRNDFALDPTWSPDGARVAWHEWDDPRMPWDESRIVDDTGTVVAAGGAVTQPRFGPDGTLGFLSDASNGWLSLWCHPEDHEHGLPAWGGGVRTWTWSPGDGGRRIAFVRNEAGFGRLCVLDRATGHVDEIGKGWHFGLDWRAGRLVAVRSGARTPPELVAYDDTTWTRTTLATAGEVPAEIAAGLVEPEVVAGDVPARIYNASPERRLVLWIHGGPTDQLRVDFHPMVAWLVGQGYAVLAPDHRGSTGWGRAHQQAMNGGWGVVDVDDCVAAVRAAVARQQCDTTRPAVAIGASAGGFTVLHLLARHADLFAGGVARYPVGDLIDLDERTHRFEKHYNDMLVGPVEERRRRSPIAFADRIDRPVLLLHGDSDGVVPVDQSRALAERLPHVDFHVYEGEGHGWKRPETIDDERRRIAAFLGRV
jgi:dipeptidyl aminopeptidase/acylaminoacyl peptidase